jgi:hypothetical protein
MAGTATPWLEVAAPTTLDGLVVLLVAALILFFVLVFCSYLKFLYFFLKC